MLVKELMEKLSTMDPDALILTHPHVSTDGFGYDDTMVREGHATIANNEYWIYDPLKVAADRIGRYDLKVVEII